MPDKVQRARWLGLGLVVVPLLVLIGLEVNQALRYTPQLREDRQLVVHTFEVITTAQAIERAILDAERSQRGYLLTAERSYLDPYWRDVREAPALVEKLKGLVADHAEQSRRVSDIEGLLNLRIANLRRTLEVRQSEGLEAARQLVRTDLGVETTKAIQSLLETLIATENRMLSSHLERAAQAEADTMRTALADGTLAMVTLLLALVLVPAILGRMRKTEEARRGIEERFRLVVNGITDYAVYTLDPQGRITSWNSGAARIKGYSVDEVLGRHFSMFFTEEDRAAGRPQMALEAALREGKFETEAWRLRKDGSRYFAQVLVDRLYDDAGKHIGFVKITRDITERMQQQEALDAAREALAQAQKMEAVGQLSGGIAHDFNNFLHVIKNAVEILQRRVGLDPDSARLVELVQRNADRAAGLTQRLLAFSRRQPLDPRPVQPNRLVLGITELLRQTLGESIAVETVLAGGVWSCYADANQLETAILNLAINARDAMPDGGKITIETANAALDDAYAAAHEEVVAGQYVMIAVSDTGSGMAPEVVAKAFEPFYTTKPTGRGTGLGLSQVYGFIKQSGGHVKIYSEPGTGTTVRLYLPRLAAEVPELAPQPVRQTPLPSFHETVLLVEDNDDVRASTAELLDELGYRVLTASDAHAALRILEEERVDLLFTDVGLPEGINGRQLADTARERWPQLRILFTTGYARNAIIHHGRLDPGVALIVKPFTRNELATRVRRVLSAAE